MTASLHTRSHEPELMDDPTISRRDFHDCLRDLAFVNVWTLAYRPTLRWLRQAIGKLPGGQPFTLFDIGSGGGDMLRQIARWAAAGGLKPQLTGIDLNPWSKAFADRLSPPHAAIAYETTDIFAFAPDRQADFIISSLFTHHLDDAQLVRFLQWMEHHATRGWFVNDLHRHALAYHGFKYLSRWLRLHYMVQHDGPVSIARAFTRADWERLLDAAAIPRDQVQIRWRFPFRYVLSRRKP